MMRFEVQNPLRDVDGYLDWGVLVTFAIKIGASNLVIGLLAAIGPLAQLLQLPSILLGEKGFLSLGYYMSA